MVGEEIPVAVNRIEDEVTGKVTYSKQCSACGYETPEYSTVKQADREIDQHLRDQHGFGKITTHKAKPRDVLRGERNLALSQMGLGSGFDLFDQASPSKKKTNPFALLDNSFLKSLL